MRNRLTARSLVAATVVSLGVAALPATAQAGLLSDLLQPVVDLLGDGGSGGPGTSGPGNAPDPPPPAAPAPPMTPTTPAPTPAPAAAPAASPAPATPAPPVAAPPARPVSPISMRYLVRRHLLRPAPGTVLGGLRPTLRWRGGPARADLFNVQVFSATGVKVMSAFSTSHALRVPPKRLAPGRRYVWRVWPYIRGQGYTQRPLALSWFATASRTVLAH